MPVSRSTVQAFYQAYVSLDPARVEPFLDDDVDWMISGPVDVLAYCGQRHGKRAVLEVFETLVPNAFKVTGFGPQALLVDGDRAALLSTVSGVTLDGARKISYRVAHFLRFRDDKLVEFRSLIDSLDAAEQMLGYAINLTRRETSSNLTAVGDRIAV